MTKVLKAILPNAVVEELKRLRMVKCYVRSIFRDSYRFYKRSGVFSRIKSEAALASLITIDYHRLEKGLALPDPRLGFGKTAVSDLQRNLISYVSSYGKSQVVFEAVSAMDEYFIFNSAFSKEEPNIYKRYLEIKEIIGSGGGECSASAGTENTSRSEVLNAVKIDYKRFFENRHSVRDFSSEPVDNELLEEAVLIAQQAPSVCNRQPWKAYCVVSGSMVKKILSIHGGARGFEDCPDKLLVVSVDLNAFHYVGERNECWVDGGIFTMSLLNALHAVGLAACCLNWCVDDARDRTLRSILSIPNSEVLIALIAVGNYPDRFKVPVSPSKALDEAIVYCDVT